ncbi:uncharacterized protein L3040_002567 [Drepanopeziza brunnea f. sp. 'multigermtubi']|nr:hypothetical protein L3040_002567 [Drepanopeziza brunnea f. sp. 'multigermtubi']
MSSNGSENEDGVSVRDMRLKVLYTFDDKNQTNCLARWPHVLQVQTVAMDEATSIGVIELKICIDAIVQCSPELVARLGQDYTVYAYDYSEYDNPLVGQGMLSRALSTASPTPGAPAGQSRQLITGRVCKNIMGLFSNGVKETLEVKLRLVPVPTMLQGEYQNTMGRYREMNKAVPPGSDLNEWNSFMQSNPNLGQMAKKISPAPMINPNMRDGASMEVMNQLLSPHSQQPIMQDLFNQQQFDQAAQFSQQACFNQQPQYNQQPQLNHQPQVNHQPQMSQNHSLPVHQPSSTPLNPAGFTPVNGEKSRNESQEPVAVSDMGNKTSRPSSRVSVKRPRAKKPKVNTAVGGNTSGYEEGTDGDDGSAPKKRAKVTKTSWDGNASLGINSDSLRVAAGTSGSLRLFRPIAMSGQMQAGGPPGSHLVEIPRAPTPVPRIHNQHIPSQPQSSLRPASSASQNPPPQSQSLHPSFQTREDQVRRSIESAHPSPDRFSPVETPIDMGSSPPAMRTRLPSSMHSSPPCPSSPVLPQMPRTDSGFMSGSMDDLFGEEEAECPADDGELEIVTREEFEQGAAHHRAQNPPEGSNFNFIIQEEVPGPPELLPTRMPEIGSQSQVEGIAKAVMGYANGSVVSEDGQVLPPLKKGNRAPMRRAMSQPDSRQPQYQAQKSSLGPGLRDTRSTLPEIRPHPQSMSQPPPDLPCPTGNFMNGMPMNGLPAPNSQYASYEQARNPHISAPAPQNTPHPAILQTNSKLAQKLAPGPAPSQPLLAPAPASAPASASAPLSRPTSRSGMMVRTASMGSLSLPQAPSSDPVLPPPVLHQSQIRPAAPQPASEAPTPSANHMQQQKAPVMTYQGPPPPRHDNMVYKPKEIKKDYIKKKLELAIANGEMPPYCANCGAVETPTWRKAWSQDLDGEPGYHEYSDKPGRVTAIIILERDEEEKPTKYRLVKKSLGDGEMQTEFREFILCNPCGIWMSKYKAQRPSNMWESNGLMRPRGENKPPGNKRKPTTQRSRAKKGQVAIPTSEANFPMSDIPASDANFPMSEAPGTGKLDGVSSGDARGIQQPAPVNTEREYRSRSTSAQPKRKLHAMTSDAASAALRRAIQSSPARWIGTQRSPIDVEDEPARFAPTRRLLFPSPRKDGSPKSLGEVEVDVQVTTAATEFHSPQESMTEVQIQDKENCPPVIDDDNVDADLLQLFEEEMAKGNEIERPSTPVQKTPTQNPFKTPTRPTPSHRPITRSVSRSIRSARSRRSANSPSQLRIFDRTPTRTPRTGTRRRSPRNEDPLFESPFTQTLNQLMAEANNQESPSRPHTDLELDFDSLPDLGQQHNVDLDFNLEDFYSTDVPMPSSPPAGFGLYEDPAMREQLGGYDHAVGTLLNKGGDEDEDMHIKEEPGMSPTKMPEARKQVCGEVTGEQNV